MLPYIHKPAIGKRVYKTCISALLVALFYRYALGGRNPCFACIGAVYGMGSSFKEGFLNGFNRFVGTLLGGLMVIPFYWLCQNAPSVIPWIPAEIYMVAGLFATMALNLAFGAPSAIQPGTVVYFVVMYTQPEYGYISYTLARIIDTGVGAAVSLAFSALFRHEPDKSGISLRDAFQHWVRQSDGHVARHAIKPEED
jgi:uncharacterized membrane protein YgaE (UPF0421/DUF939 family)